MIIHQGHIGGVVTSDSSIPRCGSSEWETRLWQRPHREIWGRLSRLVEGKFKVELCFLKLYLMYRELKFLLFQALTKEKGGDGDKPEDMALD